MFTIEELKLYLRIIIDNNLLNFECLLEIFENCCSDSDHIELNGEVTEIPMILLNNTTINKNSRLFKYL